MTVKVLPLVTSCKGCPNRHSNECALVNERIADMHTVAPFCPLPDYPSHLIAQMETTISALSDPNKYGFSRMILAFIATKLTLNLSADGRSLVIPTTDDRQIRFDPEYVTKCETVPGLDIEFRFADGTFRLTPDTNPPTLSEAVMATIEGEQKQLWHPLGIVPP